MMGRDPTRTSSGVAKSVGCTPDAGSRVTSPMPLIMRITILGLLLLAGLGCSERANAPLQWTDRQRVVRVELARDTLRVLGGSDAEAVRAVLPEATAIEIADGAAVLRFPAVSDDVLSGYARRLAPLGEVQAAIVGDTTGWLGHRVTAALPTGRDPAVVAERHGLTLVERPAYAPDHAIFTSDATSLTSAIVVAQAMVAAGDAVEAVPSIHRQQRPRAR